MKARYEELWQIRAKFLLHTFQVKSRLDRDSSLRLIRGELRPINPVAFHYNLGSVPRDLMPTSAVGRYLLRERIFDMFCAEAFTGWLSYPVAIAGKDNEELMGYRGLQITGRAGEPDLSRGVLLPHVPGTLVQRRGLFFRDDVWDGSDLFLCNLRVCVTDRVRAALESFGVDNIEFVRLDAVKMVAAPPPST